MKKILSILLLISFTASAQTLECPTIEKKNRLVGASAYFDKISQIQGERKDLKNGHNEILPLNVRYLVCEYENETKSWKYFQPKDEITSCILETRERRRKIERVSLICT